MLINAHCRVISNVGDFHCAPVDYFPFESEIERVHLKHLRRRHYKYPIILGGGGLLFFEKKKRLSKIVARKKTKMIAWGIGHNTHGDTSISYQGHQYLKDFDLCGVRDYDAGLRWVPCPSAMSILFDQKYTIKHDVGIFSHQKFPIEQSDSAFPTLTNSTSFVQVINFIASVETLVTSSYHGAYWATLLGRKVVTIPFSSKFYGLKHKPLFAEQNTWNQRLHQTQSYPHALEECRSANMSFFYDVTKTLES